jgi:hypothetical protein
MIGIREKIKKKMKMNNIVNFQSFKLNEYKEFNNYLYHTTSIRSMIEIIKTDSLLRSGSKADNISFSRSNIFWFNNIMRNCIRLVIDKDKLKQKYKIINFDFFGSSKMLNKETNKWKYLRNSKAIRQNLYEYEEVVYNDIIDLGKYIKEIQFTEIALGLNKDYMPEHYEQLNKLKDELKIYILKYPHISMSVLNIDNKYINGKEIIIKNKYPFSL